MTELFFTNGYGFLVGVGADLPVTVKDAIALRDVLIDPCRASYTPDQVTLLTETSANKRLILAGFDKLIEQVNQNPSATAIVYYSGHGGYIENTNEYFLVPYGYNPEERDKTAISGLEFTEKIKAIKAQKLIVLLDCCHAGGIPALKGIGETFIKSPVPQDLLNVLGEGSGRVVIASSRENELSWTDDPYSVFTACLLEALEGKASVNKDGYVRILDVLIYLFNEVPKRASGPQHPFVNQVQDLTDNFSLCYYAGGSKFVQGEIPNVESNVKPTTLTSGQRQRLEQRRDILQSEWNLRSEKLKRMKIDLVIRVGTAVTFELEHQLLQEESALSDLGDKLDSIENTLGEV